MKKRTEEHKRKLSEANKGKKLLKEQREKMSESHKGLKHSEETKAKISKTNTGKIKGSPSEEIREKQSEAMKGKYSEENHPGYRHDMSTKKIIEMKENGMSLAAIARHFKTNSSTILYRIRRYKKIRLDIVRISIL